MRVVRTFGRAVRCLLFERGPVARVLWGKADEFAYRSATTNPRRSS